MKKFILTYTLLCAISAFAFAGGNYSGKDKEIMQQAPPPCEWYRAHEWDASLWGAFVFSGNPGSFAHPDFVDPDSGTDLPTTIDLGMATHDRLIGRDNTFGGGADVKYFWSKYFGVGVEGFVLAAKTNSAGGGLGTFTFRWPIGCSRFAPYAWGGAGVLAGGGGMDYFTKEVGENNPNDGDRQTFSTDLVQNKHTRFDGQLGVGLEIRITPRIGVMTDFAWNFIAGKGINGHNNDDQDFGLVRSGLTLSY